MLLSIRLWLGEKIFGTIGYPIFPAGVRVAPKRMIKWRCQEPELEGLLYAAANTSFPIPKLYEVHRHLGQLALEIEYLEGCETLHVCWRFLSKQQKHDIVNEVSGYIKQLRKLEPPDKYRISSTNGGPCRDVRVGSSARFGPFVDSTGFHKCLRGNTEGELARAMFGDKVMNIHSRE